MTEPGYEEMLHEIIRKDAEVAKLTQAALARESAEIGAAIDNAVKNIERGFGEALANIEAAIKRL